jgi:hypothetical protein
LAKNKNISVLDLNRKRVNREEVTSILKKRKPLLVFFNGHGDNNCVKGHDNEILLAVGKDERLLISKIIYSLSCRSAKGLGPKSILEGALAYLGYDDDFIFIIEQDKIGTPLQDETAKLFLEPSNQIMVSLIKGNTIKDSHERSKKLFKENVLKTINSESKNSSLVPFLIWNMQHQVCLGQENVHF